MRIKPSEGNETFCLAPWVHTYMSPQSERRLCCASREQTNWSPQGLDINLSPQNDSYSPTNLEEFWNSPYMKEIRCKLMRGEKISQCQVCNEKILSIDIYRNYFNKHLFPHLIDEAFARTRDDGHTEMKPISFNYRISNLCNFKCRMCADQSSSAIESENRALGLYQNQKNHWALKENKIKIEKFNKDVAEKELWDAVKNKSIEEIYWVGGEPLFWDVHWEVMKHLVDSGHSKNVWVRYNTNLSQIKYKNYNLYELLPHFKNVELFASIDGTNDIGEYIRDGLNWSNWLENLKSGLFLKEQFGNWGIALDITLTSPGLFSLKSLIDLSVEMNINTLIKTTYSFDSTVIMSPLMIPRKYLDGILDDLILYAAEKSITHPKAQIFIKALRDLKRKKTFQEQFDNWEDGISKGKSYLYSIDKHRGDLGKLDNIFKTNHPELYEWWSSIPLNN